MGWAKYLEDIVSRHNGTSMAQAQLQREIDRRHPRDAAKMTINQLAQRKQKMTSLKKFAVSAPRPLPVIVLADASGSMGENGKIEALNASLKSMVATFAKESRLRAEIQVGLITFGGKAQMHLPLVAAHRAMSRTLLNG
jgi:Mg-chelatase subunit ChlD